jgi:hypothetical protein
VRNAQDGPAFVEAKGSEFAFNPFSLEPVTRLGLHGSRRGRIDPVARFQ